MAWVSIWVLARTQGHPHPQGFPCPREMQPQNVPDHAKLWCCTSPGDGGLDSGPLIGAGLPGHLSKLSLEGGQRNTGAVDAITHPVQHRCCHSRAREVVRVPSGICCVLGRAPGVVGWLQANRYCHRCSSTGGLLWVFTANRKGSKFLKYHCFPANRHSQDPQGWDSAHLPVPSRGSLWPCFQHPFTQWKKKGLTQTPALFFGVIQSFWSCSIPGARKPFFQGKMKLAW